MLLGWLAVVRLTGCCKVGLLLLVSLAVLGLLAVLGCLALVRLNGCFKANMLLLGLLIVFRLACCY